MTHHPTAVSPRQLGTAPNSGAVSKLKDTASRVRAFFEPRNGGAFVASRRAMLGRVAAALAVGTSVNVGVIAARSATLPVADLVPLAPMVPASVAVASAEDPALIAIGERIEPCLSAYRAAVEAKQAAMAACRESCPPWPEEIVRRPSDKLLFPDAYYYNGALFEEVRDFDDSRLPLPIFKKAGPDGIVRDYANLPVSLLSSKLLQAKIDDGLYLGRQGTRRRATILQKLKLAKRYERQRKAAIKKYRIEDRCNELSDAYHEVYKLADQASEIPPQTTAGVVIYARAITALNECRDGASWHGNISLLSVPMADAVLRVMGRQS